MNGQTDGFGGLDCTGFVLLGAAGAGNANGSGCVAAVAVLDRGGNVIVQQRGDAVGPHNTEAARLKAYTALSTKTPTRAFAERARNNPEAANLTSLGQLLLLVEIGGGARAVQH
ncbi:MAG: heme-binding protein, partial [Proteobacteria bacterium]